MDATERMKNHAAAISGDSCAASMGANSKRCEHPLNSKEAPTLGGDHRRYSGGCKCDPDNYREKPLQPLAFLQIWAMPKSVKIVLRLILYSQMEPAERMKNE